MFSTKEVGCFRLLKNKLIRCSNADHIIVMQHELYFHFWFLSERHVIIDTSVILIKFKPCEQGNQMTGQCLLYRKQKNVWGEARCSQWKQEDSINIVFDVTVEICGFRKKAIISWYEWNLVVNYVFLKR